MEPVKQRQKKNHVFVLALLVFLQAGFTHCYIPVSEWFSSNPVYTDDYSIHYGDALYKAGYLRNFGMLFAYNPFLRAGTAYTAVTSVDNYGWALFVAALGWFSTGFAYKLYILLTLLGVPLFLYVSARNFGLGRTEGIVSAFAGTIFLQVSICVDFLYWGTVSYILSCYLSILSVSFLVHFSKHKKFFDVLWFALLLSYGFAVHVFTAVHVLVPGLVCYGLSIARLSVREHLLIAGAALFVLLSNSLWLLPSLTLIKESGGFPPSFFYVTESLLEPFNTYIRLNPKFNEYMNIPFQKTGFVDLLLLVCGIAGVICLVLRRQQLAGYLFGASAFSMFVLAYYGSFWDVTARLTPLRFVIFLNMLLLFPAAVGLCALFSRIKRSGKRKVMVGLWVIVFCIVAAVCATPYYHLFVKKDFRLQTTVPKPLEELVQWLKDNTDPNGRVLIENSDFATGHQYYGTHMSYLFPLLTGREFLGNYSPYTPTPDQFSSFADGLLFGRDVAGFSADELWRYIELYNIRWVIVWSEGSKSLFSGAPERFLLSKKIEDFHVYTARRNGTFFLKGSGKITARPSRIELSNVQPEDDTVIISYHWSRYFRATPEVPVEPTLFYQDPVGFITLKNPPENVTLFFSYPAVFATFGGLFH